MMGAAATSMSDFFEGDKINISPPEAEVIELTNNTIGLDGVDDDDGIVQVVFNMRIGDLIDSQIVQIMTIKFAKELVDSLIKPVSDVASGLDDAVEEDDGPTEASNQQSIETGPTQQQTERSQPQQQQQPTQPRRRPDASKSNQVRRDVEVQNVEFEDLANVDQNKLISELDLIYDVDLELTVRLGKTKKSIKEILEMSPGSVIELDRLAGEAVDLLVNGKLIAKGEVVVIDENFGFRVTDIVSSAERINTL